MSDPVPQYDFDAAFQAKIAALFLRDTTFALRTKDLIRPEYFTETSVGQLVRLVQDHVEVYKASPDLAVIPQLVRDAIAAKTLRKDEVEGLREVIKRAAKADLASSNYVVDRVADFAKHQAIEQAFLASIPALEKGQFSKIAETMRQALSVGAVTDGDDYDYFEEIKNRTQVRKDLAAGKIVRDGISTGHSKIDAHLYHFGWGRKELSCIMGPAKSGKTLSLAEFSKNATLAGHNVLYDSLEVRKEIIAERLDAAISSVLMNQLHKSPDDVEAAVKALHAKAGQFKMRDHPSGTLKPSQLNRLIEKYRADGVVLDMVTVDYADIMAAEYRSDNLIDNLRSIYIDLRAIAHEHNIAVLTATQTNREGAKAATAKATDVGDDWNKARTVDVMLGLAATEQEVQDGEARIAWLLSRNTEAGFQLRIKQDRSRGQFLTSVIGRV